MVDGDTPESQEKEEFDPLLDQAERLPSFLKGGGSDGPHVRPVKDEEEEEIDDGEGDFGGGIGDPSKLTAD
jgi:hypothetical protein